MVQHTLHNTTDATLASGWIDRPPQQQGDTLHGLMHCVWAKYTCRTVTTSKSVGVFEVSAATQMAFFIHFYTFLYMQVSCLSHRVKVRKLQKSLHFDASREPHHVCLKMGMIMTMPAPGE